MRPPNLNVATRGVIYILLPAAFQLICMALLLFLLNEENVVADRESHTKEVWDRANWMCVLVSSAVAGRLANLETGSQSGEKLYADATAQLSSDMKSLKSLVQDEPHLQAAVEKSQPALEQLQNAMKPRTDATPEQQARAIVAAAEQTWTELMMQRRNLVRGENELASMTPKTVLRTLKIQLIAVLILFTVASALIVIYRFGRTIASRIAVTSENTRRLPQRIPLHPPITGDDEIAQMDHAFHDMADALAAAQLRRQEYISMISHDIKTPLTSIYGSVEYLDTGCGGELTEKGFHMTARAMRNIERVLSLINSLLYVEQLESGMADITVTDESLKLLVEEAVESIEDLAEKQNVRVASSVEDVQVAVDARRTEQVLINLFSNALKFSPDGSSIEVSSRVRGNEIELSVTDHGRGVPPDAQEKIFHRFQQVEESDATERGGHGLGLAICRAIVSAQGGTIGVTSTPGQGATFWFTMKRAASG